MVFEIISYSTVCGSSMTGVLFMSRELWGVNMFLTTNELEKNKCRDVFGWLINKSNQK